MQHADMDMAHALALACRMDMHYGQTSLTSIIDMQHRNAADRQHAIQWTGSMDMGSQHGHERPS
jgi:hypothetical protein